MDNTSALNRDECSSVISNIGLLTRFFCKHFIKITIDEYVSGVTNFETEISYSYIRKFLILKLYVQNLKIFHMQDFWTKIWQKM